MNDFWPQAAGNAVVFNSNGPYTLGWSLEIRQRGALHVTQYWDYRQKRFNGDTEAHYVNNPLGYSVSGGLNPDTPRDGLYRFFGSHLNVSGPDLPRLPNPFARGGQGAEFELFQYTAIAWGPDSFVSIDQEFAPTPIVHTLPDGSYHHDLVLFVWDFILCWGDPPVLVELLNADTGEVLASSSSFSDVPPTNIFFNQPPNYYATPAGTVLRTTLPPGPGPFHLAMRYTSANGYVREPAFTITFVGAVPPVALCRSVIDPHDLSGLTVNFDGTGSHDPDGVIIEYSWHFTGTNGRDLGSATGPTPTVTFPDYDTITAVLTVTDNDGLKATDTCPDILLASQKASLNFDEQAGSHHHFYAGGGQARVTRHMDDTSWAVGVDNDVAIGGSGVVAVTHFRAGHLLGCVYGTAHNVFLSTSIDEGATWSEPMTITAGQLIDSRFDEHGGMLYTLFKDGAGAAHVATQHLEHDDTLSAPQISVATGLPANLRHAALAGTGGLLILTVQNGANIDRYTADNNDGTVWA